MTKDERRWAREFIETQVWQFAKTMPQWPHWYIIAGEGNSHRDFRRLAQLIEAYGQPDKWGRETRLYLRIAKFKYWVMEDVINRATPIASSEVRRRGEVWMRRHHKRVGPYGRLVSVDGPIRKEGRMNQDDRKPGEVQEDESEPTFTIEQYKRAFETLGLPESYLAMLRFHFRQPARTATATQIARAAQYKGYGGANLHYARLGQLVGEQLGWRPEMPLSVLVTFEKPADEWNWIMRDAVAGALQKLGWV